MRFIETVRRLRLEQATALVKHRLQNQFDWSRPVREAPPLPDVRLRSLPFIPPVQPAENANAPQTGYLSFLNRSEHTGWPPRWTGTDTSRLWQYNLHYHDFIWVLPFEKALELVHDWIDRHRNDSGAVGWDPYPISLRLQNWCMYFFGTHRSRMTEAPDAAALLWNSIFQQTFWLQRRIEHHLLANHILENGAALALAGATFGGHAGDGWLNQGCELLERHLKDVILDDGGHVERSPMYHARLCQMLENLARTGMERLEGIVREPLNRAWPVLGHLSHPDGQIALLNDSAFGIHPGTSEMGMKPPEPGVFALPDSGYYGASTIDGHYVVCDAGPVGPDYQPGHAHGDTLSFELSLQRSRFIVDAGVTGYEPDRWRAYARSTRAHNTIEINRRDQCDFWGSFRVGRRAYPRDVRFESDLTGFTLEAEHSGYDHLEGNPVHRRRIRWSQKGLMMIRDRVSGRKPVWVRSHIHLHPEVSVDSASTHALILRRNGAACAVTFTGPGRLMIEPSWCFPEFGRILENKVLVISTLSADVENGFCIVRGEVPAAFDLDRGLRLNDEQLDW